jgi:hypothetical protein
MKISLLRELTLYRYRFIIGYGLCVVLVALMLFVDIASVPYGLKANEMSSAVASNSIDPFALKPTDIVNLPYYLLQKLSIFSLGLTTFSIRLPSILLACIGAVVLALTLNHWFKKNIALLTLLITTTSTAFIAMGRSGSANIIYVTILFVILLSAVELTSHARASFFWKILLTTAGLSLLYMPLGVYVIAALFISGLLHPHVRHQVRRTKWWQYMTLLLFIALLLSPLIASSFHDLSTIKSLFGVDSLRAKLSGQYLADSLSTLYRTFFGFNEPYVGRYIAPFFSLPMTFLIIFGLVRMVKDRHAARSYMMLVWLIVAIPLLIINPGQLSFIFVPCVILIAIGLETLLNEWYRIFPRNPYARLSALVPLTLIVLGIMAISVTRFFYGYYYSDISATFSPGLNETRQLLKPGVSTTLVVRSDQETFYDILRKQYPLLTVTSSPVKVAQQQIVSGTISSFRDDPPERILTSYYKTDAVVLRSYAPGQ